ncbi:MAG: SRPBCC family protein [Syntrophobacterales bacterium]|nr:MAG: SRPBCC family protein [Syntrophobacterales bacterium]
MARIEAKIEIEAPVEKVFDYVANVAETHVQFFRFVQKVEPTSTLKRGLDSTFRYEAKSGGIKNWFENKVTNYVENERMEWTSMAGMKNEGRWAFVPTEKGTEVTFLMDYELPASYLGKVLDKLFVERENRKDINESLQRLKAILEG